MGPKSFQIGVKGIIITDNRVLLLQRPGARTGPFWELPGGRMEASEEIEQTLRRELGEELPGISRVVVGPLLHAAPVPDAPQGLVLLFYRVLADLPPTVAISTEHLGHTWASADAIASPAASIAGLPLQPFTVDAIRLAIRAAK